MNEKEYALEIYKELKEATEELQQRVKDFICCECFRDFDNSLSYEKLINECKKLGIICKKASEDKYYKKQIDKNKMNDCYVFTLN